MFIPPPCWQISWFYFDILKLSLVFKRSFLVFFFLLPNLLMMKSPITDSNTSAEVPWGRGSISPMTLCLPQKRESSPVLTHRAEGPCRSRQSLRKEECERRKLSFFFFKSSELCYHRQVSPTVSYISFLGKEHWASAIAEACALLINCCFRRVEAPRGNTHSRWHLKVFLFYRDFRLLTL